ncbi:MAG: KamA family radical SAM protein [Firmicutes bacterium]|nr:KamA family radical SAM protein [Bacillota bacterium]
MENWDSWQWQLRQQIRTVEALRQYVAVSEEEAAGIREAAKEFGWGISPYYASLMDPEDPNCPLRRQAIPSLAELHDSVGLIDPLGEVNHSPVPGLIHLYPDRVAFTVSNRCAMYCRHCIRKRMVNRKEARYNWRDGVEYIRRTPQIRDVLLTGGDPLLLPDHTLEQILKALREIEHVEIIRIGTRTVCTLPQRITPELVGMLEKYHPIWLNTQFNHPKELTPQAQVAIERLLRAGIPVGNQSVLLKGVNDNVDTMKALVQKLVRFRVRPYYLYQCDVLRGTEHFRTPIETGLNIINSLQGFTSGLAVPTFIVDSPAGKIPLHPDRLVERGTDYIVIRSFEGKIVKLPNPPNQFLAGNGSKMVENNKMMSIG